MKALLLPFGFWVVWLVAILAEGAFVDFRPGISLALKLIRISAFVAACVTLSFVLIRSFI